MLERAMANGTSRCGLADFLTCAVGQLEADEVEQQHADQKHEAACRGRVAARAQPVGAVLDRVDDDRNREQAEQDEPGERPRRGQPLGLVERQDGRDHRQPDERQHHDVEHRGGHAVPLLKKTLTVPTQVTASVPPIQTGLVIQYRKLFTAPARWPKASRVHR